MSITKTVVNISLLLCEVLQILVHVTGCLWTPQSYRPFYEPLNHLKVPIRSFAISVTSNVFRLLLNLKKKILADILACKFDILTQYVSHLTVTIS